MRIIQPSTPEMTRELVYLKGQFFLWQYCIPYFLSTVPWDFARDKFTLIENVPSSAREEWSLSELFQREIDWERIRQELVKYLRNEAQPQFFNALTIALLPKEGDTFGGEYKTQREYPPMIDPDSKCVATPGMLFVAHQEIEEVKVRIRREPSS